MAAWLRGLPTPTIHMNSSTAQRQEVRDCRFWQAAWPCREVLGHRTYRVHLLLLSAVTAFCSSCGGGAEKFPDGVTASPAADDTKVKQSISSIPALRMEEREEHSVANAVTDPPADQRRVRQPLTEKSTQEPARQTVLSPLPANEIESGVSSSNDAQTTRAQGSLRPGTAMSLLESDADAARGTASSDVIVAPMDLSVVDPKVQAKDVQETASQQHDGSDDRVHVTQSRERDEAPAEKANGLSREASLTAIGRRPSYGAVVRWMASCLLLGIGILAISSPRVPQAYYRWKAGSLARKSRRLTDRIRLIRGALFICRRQGSNHVDDHAAELPPEDVRSSNDLVAKPGIRCTLVTERLFRLQAEQAGFEARVAFSEAKLDELRRLLQRGDTPSLIRALWARVVRRHT